MGRQCRMSRLKPVSRWGATQSSRTASSGFFMSHVMLSVQADMRSGEHWKAFITALIIDRRSKERFSNSKTVIVEKMNTSVSNISNVLIYSCIKNYKIYHLPILSGTLLASLHASGRQRDAYRSKSIFTSFLSVPSSCNLRSPDFRLPAL